MSTVLPAGHPRADAAPGSATYKMLHAPLMPTLLRLATPNVIGLVATTIVIGYDGYILGRLGADALGGIALVLPLAMLMLQMSVGGIGGATTAAVARALGAGRSEDAGRLAQQALFIGGLLAAIFTLVLLGFGRAVFAAMGGTGAALSAALAYSNVLFGGAIVIWSANVLAAVVRGAGNMLLPSLMLLGTALVHLALCPLLVFGWGPVPALGVAGAATSTLAVNALAAAVLVAYLLRRHGAVHLHRSPWRLRVNLLRDILRVGLPASLSPVISNACIAVATAFVGSFGTAALAGYGIAARLEYILVPIAFGFGTALTAMVATNMGAGQTARALRVAWAGGARGGGHHRRDRLGGIDRAGAVDEPFHGRYSRTRLRGFVSPHRGWLLRDVRSGAGAVLCFTRRGAHVLACRGQPGPSARPRGRRLGLHPCVPDAGHRILRCRRGQPVCLRRGHRRRHTVGQLDTLTGDAKPTDSTPAAYGRRELRLESFNRPRRWWQRRR